MDFPDQDESTKVAPWYNIPADPIMSVEHPCIVKNSMKGIDMLGGSRTISQVLDAGADKTLPLFFSPQDPSCRSILSLHNETSNVLLKVTVPKRTGRKRKRGSIDDFIEDLTAPEAKRDAAYLLRSIADNRDDYSIEPIGNINTSHVWRNIPDFVYSTKGSTFMKNIERHVLSQKYSLLKKHFLPQTYGTEDTETIPPPVFSMQSLPQHYMYRQNPASLPVNDPVTGTKSIMMKSQIMKTHTHQWQYNGPVPTAPDMNCPPLEEQPKHLQDIVKHFQTLFEQRPIWTRRALHNCLPDGDSVFTARYALAYVAYTVRSGPWRDALVRYGVDPRSDRKYRIYQTVLLQLFSRDTPGNRNSESKGFGRTWVRGDDRESHVFDGKKPIPRDGKVWQFCDLDDKDIKPLVNIPELYLRPECENRYFGWYASGTLAKIRIVLKAKVDNLLKGSVLDPKKLELFLKLPDDYDPNSTTRFNAGFMPSGLDRSLYEWATAYRNICTTPIGTVPTYGSQGRGRLSLTKPTARPSYLDPDDPDNSIAVGSEVTKQDQVNASMEGDQEEDNSNIANEYAEPAEDDEDDEDGDDDNDEEVEQVEQGDVDMDNDDEAASPLVEDEDGNE